jgi:hypothetical protein
VKALADFVMRGHSSATLVTAVTAVLFWLFPPFLIVSSAAIALVTLRRGAGTGALLMALAGWAATILVWLVLGTPWPMLEVLPASWLPAWLLALVLRATVSLARTLQAAALLGGLSVAAFYLVLGDPAIWWISLITQWQEKLAALGPATGPQAALEPLLALLKAWAPLLPGQAVSAVLLYVVSALLLARWWQALLFNPGGFRSEFHSLRLGRPLAALLLALFGAAALSGWPPLINSVLMLGALYTVQGIALMHAIAFTRQLSVAWLLLFYLLLLPLLSQWVMALAVADAWADFRGRIRPRLGGR